MKPAPFDNSYVRLPQSFYECLDPQPVRAPRLVAFNRGLARHLGLAWACGEDSDLAAIFSGNRLPAGAEPLAMAYAGHQFGHFVPQLGDGRALLLGEVVDRAGVRRDIALKGSGQTPFSRGGDGRAALGPVLREFLLSEAMHALGVPTTRALAAVVTGQKVARERALPGAVVTRVARSHVRVGTFQYFAARRDTQAVRVLADYVIARHDPELAGTADRYSQLLRAVIERQARLVAKWLSVGFIHGVMNTDNAAISGETIDYGPCAFMDEFNPGQVFSSIDRHGRYAYDNQPGIAQWNLARLAETLLPLLDNDDDRALEQANQAVGGFAQCFAQHWRALFGAKLGLAHADAADSDLIHDLLALMHHQHADFTLTFRHLADAIEPGPGDGALVQQLDDPTALEDWLVRWRTRLAAEQQAPEAIAERMRAVNPAIIARNHLVERAIRAAEDDDDFAIFDALRDALARPFEPPADGTGLQLPPQPHERVTQTFCGT
ncbi:MAG: YdiU family protein [Xanthomonadaceae bacterium]|nr:YdiU family protein [Xanthomonadaceae bacterium]